MSCTASVCFCYFRSAALCPRSGPAWSAGLGKCKRLVYSRSPLEGFLRTRQ